MRPVLISLANFLSYWLQRLRQEKLGLLLKCFTEMSNLHEILQSGMAENDDQSFIPHQRVSKAMNIQPVSKIIEDTEDSEDSIVKLTGRL